MGLTLFTDKTSWENARKDVRHTATTLTASDVHGATAKPLKVLLSRWNDIDQERRDADDKLVDANALVAWIDVRALDPLVTELASLLQSGGGGAALEGGQGDPREDRRRAQAG